jgi:hypothetical protein
MTTDTHVSEIPRAEFNSIPGQSESHNVGAESGRVAVIAIHGVGRHAPGASADAVATLLLSLGRNSGSQNDPAAAAIAVELPPYSGFVTTSIDVPLRPVQSPSEDAKKANDRHQPDFFSRVWGLFNERRGFLAESRAKRGGDPSGYDRSELRPDEPDRGEYGYRFMVTQLAGYKGVVDRDFQTVRMEGQRKDDSQAPTVHIYDAHYSDLSKPESNIVAFFFAFYQLLFHLASLSLLAVYWTEAENVAADPDRRWRWRIAASLHATAVRLLTMFVPILNVVLLEIACSAFIDKTDGQGWLPWVSCTIAAILGIIAAFLTLRNQDSPSRPFLWASIPFAGAGAGILVLGGSACLYNSLFHLTVWHSQTLLLFSWLTIAGVLLGWIAAQFEQLRPGAFWLAIVLYVGNTLWFLLYLLPHAKNQFATAALWAVQWIFGELLLSWIICLFCEFLTRPLGVYCARTIRAGSEEPASWAEARRARAIAAFRTGRFAFAIPAILFVIVTCTLWSGVVTYGSYKLKAFDGVTLDAATTGLAAQPAPSVLIPGVCKVSRWMARIDPVYATKECADPSPLCAGHNDFWTNYLKGLLLVSVTPSLPITMALFTASLLLLIWAALPSIFYELNPDSTAGAATDKIRFLGKWLSKGLDNTAILTRVLWVAIVPIPLLFFAVDWWILNRKFSGEHWVNISSNFTLPLIEKVGFALAVSAAAIFGFILKYSTTILDAVLDVDNYLRTSPQEETPRAKIAERITSLLRYVARQRDDQGRPYYSKLIIVAHSLGTMVTADLLRYLERSGKGAPDADLARYGFRKKPGEKRGLPIYVLSMGSPLRQLLNRFFPHLYWWISDIPDNSIEPLSDPVGPPMPGIASPLPRTDEMNVTHWSNAYRSGDYIGRSLWVGQWMQRNAGGDPRQYPDIAHNVAPRACDEMCIGLGAHTHYWDRSAPEVAVRLDALIALP